MTTDQTIGIGGYPAAGNLTSDTPELVGYRRGRGYPYRPFDAMPEKFIPGASGIGKVLGDDWSWWARRVCARVAAKMRTELAGYSNAKDAERALYAAAEEEQWQPANDGTSVHLHTALSDAGRSTDHVEIPDRLSGHLEAWEAFKTKYQVGMLAIERTGYAPEFAGGLGAAGTIDRLITVGTSTRPDAPVICDLKTKSQPLSKVKVSVEHLMQVVALAHCTVLAIEEHQQLVELPQMPRAVLVYLCRDGYRAQWIDPHQPELIDLAAHCIAARAGKERLGTGAWGTPDVQPLHDQAPALVDVPTDLNKEKQPA